MRNERNAGRKPKISNAEMKDIILRHEAGEGIPSLASEYGISRQALYKRLKESSYKPVSIEYYTAGELCTLIEVDFRRNDLHVVNYAVELSRRAFGYIDDPGWDDFLRFIEDYYLDASGRDRAGGYFLSECGRKYSLEDIPPDNGDKHLVIRTEHDQRLPVFSFNKKEIILTRSDTDGFQMKALTSDRKYFVKAQAVMSGVKLNDWAVEIISTGICRQLGIPCVEQKHCRFVYGGREYDGVYSPNFELDGYTFMSFEGLLERMHRSSKEDEFIKLGAIEKLKWCAALLSEAGNIPYEDTEKYVLDLAVLDCIIGNVDRHTRNFGLFYNVHTGKFEIPLVFDSGMGLFENDPYRDEYRTFEEAMNHVYVAPYGEDPFDMLELLDKEYGLRSIYGNKEGFKYGDVLKTEFALEYEKRMNELWQRSG